MTNLSDRLLTLFYRIYPKYHFIKFDEIDNMLDSLSKKIKESRFNPDIIIGVLSGGKYPAEKIAARLKKKAIFIKAKSYSITFFGFEIEFLPVIKRILYLLGYKEKTKLIKRKLDVKGKKILVVDDECSTYNTLKVVKKYLESEGAGSIKTAVLINYKENKEADYWVKPSKKLCIFPWINISPYHKKII